MPNCPAIDHNGGNSAYYTPSKDTVSMPKREQFQTNGGYYLTLFHELAHSTGHFTRLDRFKKNKEEYSLNHKKDYSFEELVAEMTACFVGSHCGIMNESMVNNSGAYITGWISKLQSNTDWIVKASGQATKAMEFILDIQKDEVPAK
jgi:antirestriction protein ArdC